MKTLILCSLLACTVYAYNLRGDNKPECHEGILNKPIRNFWDPNRYWLCKTSQAEAESVRCPNEKAFDEVKGKCISFREFTWVKPGYVCLKWAKAEEY